jgi:hypothetical protein
MTAAKAVRTSDNNDDNATMQRRDNVNNANNDADVGEDDADEDEDKKDRGGHHRAAIRQICRPAPLLCLDDAVAVFVIVVVNGDNDDSGVPPSTVHVARGCRRHCRHRRHCHLYPRWMPTAERRIDNATAKQWRGVSTTCIAG